MRTTSSILIAALALTSTAAFAETSYVPGREPTTMDNQIKRLHPPTQAVDYNAEGYGEGDYSPPADDLLRISENGVKYATGGVGEEEEAQLKSLGTRFNLKLLSTLEDGAYLGYYAVRVTDASGKSVFEAPGDGPYFFVNLPAGRYDVEILRRDQPGKSQKVTIGNSGSKVLQFRFPGAAGAKSMTQG